MKPLGALLALVYPPKCPFCGRVLERWEEGMCTGCQQSLPWTDGVRGGTAGCDACLAPLYYRDGVRDAVHRYKFNGGMGHAQVFGPLMAQCLKDRWAGAVDVVTYVPLHQKRRRRRGYDQAELLARRVGEATGLPVMPALEKTRHTDMQSQLRGGEERRANVAGAYRALPGIELAGRRVVLVDDVLTTGATMAECAACLRGAGAAAVVGLTLAVANGHTSENRKQGN